MEPESVSVRNDGVESGKRDDKGVYLVWEDLSVVVAPNSGNCAPKKLLSGLSGYAEPGRMMAIMGLSGSGKSTLLDALAGRLSPNVEMTGKVLINGRKRSTNIKEISYVTQEDSFLGIFTVRETLTYSAHLRLPTKMTKEETKNLVEDTIVEMGLQGCADTKIGTWKLRGISSGEKKRLSISIEILTNPLVLFLDEPTTGLDSASAFFVIQALRNIALNGRVVVCSIHQPSSDVFDLFDDLLLLSNGETVYFGEAKMAIEFFADVGFPCPTRRSPSDHFIRCISLDFDSINAALMRYQNSCGIIVSSDSLMNMKAAEIREVLIKKYKGTEYSMKTRSRIREISLTEELVHEFHEGSDASWWKQLCTLTHRSFLNMSRDIGYYWLRIICYILIAIVIGILYYGIGSNNQGIMVRAKCVGFIYSFMICLSAGGLPFFIEELKVFYRERSGGQYGEAVFILSNLLSSLPYLVLTAIVAGTIIYYMVEFHPGFSYYCFFCINLFCCIALIENFMMIIASLVPNVLMGFGVGIGLIMLLLMASEVFRPLPDLPKIFWRYPMSYVSFARWAIQGQYKNEMIGLEFDALVPGLPKLKGEQILQTMFGVPLDHSKWWDLTALICLLMCHRVLLLVVLKYKQKGSLVLCHFFNKRTSRTETVISSKRQHPQHQGVGSISIAKSEFGVVAF
ncbi:ABC_tran domain-containing protein/ABC2_membrane domain-containing protein [Cephalotus follicularis]|uniref:ABC_tran domain-containing protein/ABC2_membrane domain-containing protein n=1 Tax=Cephalotus follicularis TaxID=3775 RepID=A0A1Q3C368_CEPFO|nr:ABC_tran domain-containing protein/ABC2_membrane domain-containing protein [Cephalotus follicularis]